MPELPEVETIRRGLSNLILNSKINHIEILNQKSFQGNPEDVLNLKILKIERRAKVLRIKFENNINLLFHLKMTGQVIVVNRSKRIAGGHPSHDWHDKLPNKHTRVVFSLPDDITIYFNDLRKFGWVKVLEDEEINEIYSKYGPEPLNAEFTVKYLIEKAKRIPKRTVKQFIMDQTIIAGVGNIYADESLFDSGILPTRKVESLKKAEWEKLASSIKYILEQGIKYGGTTDSDYVNVEGNKGGMQNYLKVYHLAGKDCDCGGNVVKTKVGGRGTYYCPLCQK